LSPKSNKGHAKVQSNGIEHYAFLGSILSVLLRSGHHATLEGQFFLILTKLFFPNVTQKQNYVLSIFFSIIIQLLILEKKF
jgi:hypothetical protein